MEPARILPDSWVSIVAPRLELSHRQLDTLLRADNRFAEACMDYAECVLVLEGAEARIANDSVRMQEYRFLEREIRHELCELIEAGITS